MACFDSQSEIPISHYLIGVLLVVFVALYILLEFHIVGDLLTGFRRCRVKLSKADSDLDEEVVPKCTLLHGRYLPTPWLCSPHLQTLYLRFFGICPPFEYTREVLKTEDGGTIALDWVAFSDVVEKNQKMVSGEDGRAALVVVIPGLTSDSNSNYIRRLAYDFAKSGWTVAVSNHRGHGGLPLTSDTFYNGGWTGDTRLVVKYIRSRYPSVPLFIIGTSLGANVMVKYLGEDGGDVLLDGAAAVGCPWDILLCDRFLGRSMVQRIYNIALVSGLKRYAKRHQQFFSRLADWEGILKASRVRDFDSSATCPVAKFETADSCYRESSCVGHLGGIKVPLLCISSMDDPICTKEALIFDESRVNKNILLATTHYGGHLGYIDGMYAKGIWWIRAINEFLTVLRCSTTINRKYQMKCSPWIPKSPSKQSVEEANDRINVERLAKSAKKTASNSLKNRRYVIRSKRHLF